MTPEKWRPPGIGPGPPPFQYLYIRYPLHNLQEVRLCRRPGDTSYIWRMEGVGKDSKPGHDYTLGISPDLAIEA